MRIERKKAEPKFEPIVITIESQAEFDALWIGLNHNITSFKEATPVHYPKNTEAFAIAAVAVSKMWFKLDDLYKPKS